MENLIRSSPSPERLELKLLIVTFLFPSLAILVVALRTYALSISGRGRRIEDYVVILAVVCAFGSTAFVVPSIDAGLGYHAITIQPAQIKETLKWLFASQTLNITAYYLVKLSIAGQLLRLTSRRGYLCLIYQLIVILTIAQALDYLFLFSRCTPITEIWDTSVKGTCWKANSVLVWAYVQNVIAILTDWSFVITPIILLWNVPLNGRKKIAILFILLLGVFAGCIAIFKTIRLRTLSDESDQTFLGAEEIEWSIIELNIGIIAASLPAFQYLFKSFFADEEFSVKNISLPLDWPPTPISKSRSYFQRNFSRPTKPEPHRDLESSAGLRTKRAGMLQGGKMEVDPVFRASTQEFLLGIFPAGKAGMVRFGRNNGRLGHERGDSESENEVWG